MNSTAASSGAGPEHRALIVDDEVALTEILGGYLESERFEVTTCHDGNDAVRLAREVDPDVVILDLGLPGLDGVEVCRRLRTFSDAYVVMLTARDDEIDTVVGLSVGADDYITKPFSPRELVARIRAMFRRPRTGPAAAGDPTGAQTDTPPPRVFGPLSIDVARRDVALAGDTVALTRTQFDILATLAARPGVVFSRQQILESVWGESWFGNEHLVDVHIGQLRRRLDDDPAKPRFVQTVRGVGYRMGTGQ